MKKELLQINMYFGLEIIWLSMNFAIAKGPSMKIAIETPAPARFWRINYFFMAFVSTGSDYLEKSLCFEWIFPLLTSFLVRNLFGNEDKVVSLWWLFICFLNEYTTITIRNSFALYNTLFNYLLDCPLCFRQIFEKGYFTYAWSDFGQIWTFLLKQRNSLNRLKGPHLNYFSERRHSLSVIRANLIPDCYTQSKTDVSGLS